MKKILVGLCLLFLSIPSFAVGLDRLTGNAVFEDRFEGDISEGNLYQVSLTTASLAGATSACIYIDLTSVSSNSLHINYMVNVTTHCTLALYENTTFVSSNSATSLVNMNRESSKIPNGAMKIYANPQTVLAAGTLLSSSVVSPLGYGRSPSGMLHKWILKRGKAYLILVTTPTGVNSLVNSILEVRETK